MLEEDALFSVTVDTTGPGPLVRVGGDLDLETSAELTDQLKALLGPHLLVVELSEVEFMDSTGLGVLVGAHKEQQALGGALALVGAQPRVQKILRITKLHKVFTVYPTLDDLALELAKNLPTEPVPGAADGRTGQPAGGR